MIFADAERNDTFIIMREEFRSDSDTRQNGEGVLIEQRDACLGDTVCFGAVAMTLVQVKRDVSIDEDFAPAAMQMIGIEVGQQDRFDIIDGKPDVVQPAGGFARGKAGIDEQAARPNRVMV